MPKERLPGLTALLNDPDVSDAVLRVVLVPSTQGEPEAAVVDGASKPTEWLQRILKELYVSTTVLAGASNKFLADVKRWAQWSTCTAVAPTKHASDAAEESTRTEAVATETAAEDGPADSPQSSAADCRTRSFTVQVHDEAQVQAVEACLQFMYSI
jgi:hypothetical protein